MTTTLPLLQKPSGALSLLTACVATELRFLIDLGNQVSIQVQGTLSKMQPIPLAPTKQRLQFSHRDLEDILKTFSTYVSRSELLFSQQL